MIYFLIFFILINQTIYPFFLKNGHKYLAFIFKTLASLSFVFLAFLAENHLLSVMTALLFDALGDILLGLRYMFKEKLMMAMGTVSFLLGHLFFLYYICTNLNAHFLPLLLSGLMTIIIHRYLIKRITKNFPFVLGFVYVLVLVSFGLSSLFLAIEKKSISFVLFGLGSFLFMSSDFLLISHNFIKKSALKHQIYSFLYYLGQIFIALSLFY